MSMPAPPPRSAARGSAAPTAGRTASGVDDNDADAARLAARVSSTSSVIRQPAMVVEVGDQFLDDDAEPRQSSSVSHCASPNARAASDASSDRPAALQHGRSCRPELDSRGLIGFAMSRSRNGWEACRASLAIGGLG